MYTMETDNTINELRQGIRQMLIDLIPKLMENLDKLPPDEYVKYYFTITDVVERRKK